VGAGESRQGDEREYAAMRFACPCCGHKTLGAEPPGTYLTCPVCFWEDAPRDRRSGESFVSLREAQRSFARCAAWHERYVDEVRAPTPLEARDADWRSMDEEGERIVATFAEIFADVPRPAHFTNHTHCEECAEHDAVMRSRDRATLRLEDVDNLGWNPVVFLTPEGFRYYLAALVRVAFESEDEGFLSDLVSFHLRVDCEWHFELLTTRECEVVLELIQSVRTDFASVLEEDGADDGEIEAVERYWRGRAGRAEAWS